MQRSGLVDFAELLLRSHELWLKDDALLAHYRERFGHLLVDEFQDTNTIQYAWIRVLAGQTGNVFVVGDDDQAIYGWRGAKVENVQHFLRDFPGAKTIRLEQNYRSTGNILQAANAIIANNPQRLGKKLWTERRAGTAIALYAAYNEQDEARFVVERIREHLREGGKPTECAILYRSQCAVAQLRRTADPARHPLSRLRRPAILRPRRDQGCAGLPAPRRQSPRRSGVRTRCKYADARHRRTHARRAAPARAARQRRDVGRGVARADQQRTRGPREERAEEFHPAHRRSVDDLRAEQRRADAARRADRSRHPAHRPARFLRSRFARQRRIARGEPRRTRQRRQPLRTHAPRTSKPASPNSPRSSRTLRWKPASRKAKRGKTACS